MPGTAKKILREEYNRLKKAFDKIIHPKKKEQQPQWALQPYRNLPNREPGKKYFEGY